ncbi:uncharacterized protein KY384_007954 [Bacidia gigantensis]|uniref:uncharacterized protein n=1 Tax=Bacidia gigantensis TaxID=2732470 RepID=UPI001D04F48B|nr:uncharacterized protein KY384_007954 [Bacidia gigantensis]KAG8527800.1 hypothetical protein KY384_007954 [Bacidia gigantensis]
MATRISELPPTMTFLNIPDMAKIFDQYSGFGLFRDGCPGGCKETCSKVERIFGLANNLQNCLAYPTISQYIMGGRASQSDKDIATKYAIDNSYQGITHTIGTCLNGYVDWCQYDSYCQIFNNYELIKTLCSGSSLPIAFILYRLWAVKKASWELWILSAITIALCTATFVISTGSSPTYQTKPLEIDSHLYPGCGNAKPTVFCTSLTDSSGSKSVIGPEFSIVFSSVLLALILIDLVRGLKNKYLPHEDYEDPMFEAAKERRKSIANLLVQPFRTAAPESSLPRSQTDPIESEKPLPTRPSSKKRLHRRLITTITVVLLCLYVFFIKEFITSLQSFDNPKQNDLQTWTIGQVIAIMVFLPPIQSYVTFEIRGLQKAHESRLPKDWQLVRTTTSNSASTRATIRTNTSGTSNSWDDLALGRRFMRKGTNETDSTRAATRTNTDIPWDDLAAGRCLIRKGTSESLLSRAPTRTNTEDSMNDVAPGHSLVRKGTAESLLGKSPQRTNTETSSEGSPPPQALERKAISKSSSPKPPKRSGTGTSADGSLSGRSVPRRGTADKFAFKTPARSDTEMSWEDLAMGRGLGIKPTPPLKSARDRRARVREDEWDVRRLERGTRRVATD